VELQTIGRELDWMNTGNRIGNSLSKAGSEVI